VAKELRNYETILIADPLLEDSKIDNLAEKYSEFLKKNECVIVKVDKWGRKKFAYPIKKKLTGYYVSIEFQGAPEVITKLDKTYHLDDNVLRYLTTSFDKKTLRERQQYFEKKSVDAAHREKEQSGEEHSREVGHSNTKIESEERIDKK
jgi:small subunit ribosomal protein S6